jgi:uncharacterized protein YebE (UPF0316 family)
MQEILNNSYLSALVVLISQIVFIYLRTVNVIYTAERRMLPAILTSNGIALAWLVSMSIGANSILEGQTLPIIAFLIGGTLGTYWGIKKESKKK